MKQNKQAATHFDRRSYEEHVKQIEKYAELFATSVEILKAEGMDVSAKELQTYPERFGDFAENDGKEYKAHFVALYKDAEKRAGWLPMVERQRMFDNFIAVFKRTNSAASYITDAVNFGCILRNTDNGAKVDVEATSERDKAKFIIGVDAESMAEHWRMIQELREKMDALKTWELNHGLPPISVPSMMSDHFGFAGYVNAAKYGDVEVTMDEAKHNDMVWSYFKTKKK